MNSCLFPVPPHLSGMSIHTYYIKVPNQTTYDLQDM
jgi:hypothetical protein